MPVTLQKLKELLVAPHEILPRIAKERNVNEAIVMLAINWILFSVAFSLTSANYSLIPAIIVSGILGTLTYAFFFYLALTVISGKRDFPGVLVALTYPFFGLASSSLIVALFFIWSEVFAMILGTILFMLYFTVALTGVYRVVRETHKLDVVTVWVITSLLLLAAFGSIYLVAGIYALKTGTFLDSFRQLLSVPTLYSS